jgi:hypothetical protein
MGLTNANLTGILTSTQCDMFGFHSAGAFEHITQKRGGNTNYDDGQLSSLHY